MLVKFLRAKLARLSVVGVLTIVTILSGAWFASMQAGSAPQATNCQPVVAGKIYRYIEGIDTCVIPLSNSDIDKLTDPFATALLRKGNFPDGVPAMTKGIKSSLGYDPTTYLVGEGSQIPTTVAGREMSRGLRYSMTWGPHAAEGEIMMSKLVPATINSLIEVMAFDEQTKKYNYYFLRPQVGAPDDSLMVWAWTGNTPMAREPKTIGQGCFRCHHNGVPVMREIESPWNNWQSQRANISAAVVPKAVAGESVFLQRRGAEIFEELVRGSVQHYYQDLLGERTRKEGGTTYLSKVDDLLRHLATTTTINLKSTEIQSKGEDTSPPNLDIVGVPPKDTFLSDTLFQTTLGLNYSSLAVTFPRKDYDAYLEKHKFTLIGTKGFTRETEEAYRYPSSTYFAYFVPQVPAEDIYVTQMLLQSKIVTDKFVGALLMVDYKNPLFSAKRTSLQQNYADKITKGTVANGVSSVPTDFAAKIKETGAKACSADKFDACSAEEQFLYTWELPDAEWKQLSAKRLQSYVNSVANMEPNKRLEYLMRRSIEERDRFASTATICEYFEAKLLFPDTNISNVPECPKPFAGH